MESYKLYERFIFKRSANSPPFERAKLKPLYQANMSLGYLLILSPEEFAQLEANQEQLNRVLADPCRKECLPDCGSQDIGVEVFRGIMSAEGARVDAAIFPADESKQYGWCMAMFVAAFLKGDLRPEGCPTPFALHSECGNDEAFLGRLRYGICNSLNCAIEVSYVYSISRVRAADCGFREFAPIGKRKHHIKQDAPSLRDLLAGCGFELDMEGMGVDVIYKTRQRIPAGSCAYLCEELLYPPVESIALLDCYYCGGLNVIKERGDIFQYYREQEVARGMLHLRYRTLPDGDWKTFSVR